MAELKGRSSQLVYANASLGLMVNLKGNEADVLLRGEKGKSLLDNVFFASSTIKLASNHVLRASNGLIWKPKQRGLTFNGTNGIELGNPSGLQTAGNQTIMMWLFPTSFSARRNPWNKAYGGEGTITQETNGILNYFYGTHGGNNTPYQGFGSTVLTLNQWTHVTIVRNFTTMKLTWYFNGIQVSQANCSFSYATAGSLPALIGKGYTSPYLGKIDDVRIFNIALTQAEIQEHMNHELKGDEPGLVGYWKFNEGSGTTAYDSSPNGYHGTIYGATYFTEL